MKRINQRRVKGSFALLMVVGTTMGLAQAPHTIQVQVDGLNQDTVYLANYYGNKLYYSDTTVTDAEGRLTFPGRPYEKCGKHAIVIPGPKYFEFMAVTEDIVIETNAADPTTNVNVIESDENKVFYEFLGFIGERRAIAAPYERTLGDSTATEAQIQEARQVLTDLGEEVGAEQQRILDVHADKLFAKYLKMVLEPTIPEAPKNIANAQELQYRWYLDHYWDRVDFDDPRLVHDGSFHQILDTYWTRVLPQVPDTLLNSTDRLIARAVGNDEMFKYITHYITFNSESSQVMCMDKIFVHMIDKYYATGQATWMNEEQLIKVMDRADELRDSQCGSIIPNIILPGLDQETWMSLYDVDAKYTAVLIWESTCGHCKKELPTYKELYKEWHPKGLEIYAIGNDFEPEPWQEFVEEQEYTDWINVSDNPLINAQDSASALIYGGVTTLKSLNFRTTFDVFATPKVFLLDKNKKIIGKQIGAEQMGDILGRLEEMERKGIPY
jgi:thiol-disulfide isomerase/thioredoxin